MTRAWPLMPGVPAAGHVTRGYWHPGSELTCTKGGCSTDYGARVPVTETKFPEGGHGERYCPFCGATLISFDPEVTADEMCAAHKREQRHTGRPVQINRALRLAQLSRTDVKD